MMKNTVYYIIIAVIGLIGCEKQQPANDYSDSEIIALLVDKIEQNATIMDDVYSETSKIADYEIIQKILAKTDNKGQFIDTMNTLIKDVFKRVIESEPEFINADPPVPLTGEAEITLKSLVMSSSVEMPPYFDVDGDGIALLQKKVYEMNKENGHRKWIDVLIFEDGNGETHELPGDVVSYTAEMMSGLVTVPYYIEFGELLGETESEEAIDALLVINNIPNPLAALLLPAIQKVREAAAAENESPYFLWLKALIGTEINGGLNRDIIRRFDAGGFMGAMLILLDKNYRAESVADASLALLQARYQASLYFIWDEIWRTNQIVPQ